MFLDFACRRDVGWLHVDSRKAISLNLLECVFDSAGGNQNLIGQQARYVFVLSECLTDLRRSNSAIFLSNDVRNRIDAWSHSLDVLRIKL